MISVLGQREKDKKGWHPSRIWISSRLLLWRNRNRSHLYSDVIPGLSSESMKRTDADVRRSIIIACLQRQMSTRPASYTVSDSERVWNGCVFPRPWRERGYTQLFQTLSEAHEVLTDRPRERCRQRNIMTDIIIPERMILHFPCP